MSVCICVSVCVYVAACDSAYPCAALLSIITNVFTVINKTDALVVSSNQLQQIEVQKPQEDRKG